MDLVQDLYDGVKSLIRKEKELEAYKNPPQSFFEFSARLLDGEERVTMQELCGNMKAIIILNTASKDEQAAKTFATLQ